MGTGDSMMRGQPPSGTQATLHWVGQKPTGVRAIDFVKCADPECPLNKVWARRSKQHGWTADDYKPHCHPVF